MPFSSDILLISNQQTIKKYPFGEEEQRRFISLEVYIGLLSPYSAKL